MRYLLVLLVSLSAFASKKPMKVVVMECKVDEYKVAHNGYHIPTTFRCESKGGGFYIYHLVPDHQISNSIPVQSVVGPTEVEHTPMFLPVVLNRMVPSPPDENDPK